MKIEYIINQIKTHRSSDLPEIKDAIELINEVDFNIYHEIYKHYFDEEYKEYANTSDEVLLPKQFKDVYIFYICAMMELRRSEQTKYNNDMANYSASLNSYRNFVNRNYNRIDSEKVILCLRNKK